jgi:hypothetical protein
VIGRRECSDWEYTRAGSADKPHADLLAGYDVAFALGRHGAEGFHEAYGPISPRLVALAEERLGIQIEIVL